MVIKKKRQSEIAAFAMFCPRCMFIKHAKEYYSAADSSALSNVL